MALKNLPVDHHRQFWLHHKIDPKKQLGGGGVEVTAKPGKREVVVWVMMDGGRQNKYPTDPQFPGTLGNNFTYLSALNGVATDNPQRRHDALSADDIGSSAFSLHLHLSRRHDAVSADDNDDNAGSVSLSLSLSLSLPVPLLDPSSLFSNFLMGKAEFPTLNCCLSFLCIFVIQSR